MFLKVLDDLFLIKRLQTIQQFFKMCRSMGQSFRSETGMPPYEGDITCVYSDEEFNKPIKTFASDYVATQLLGITSQCLAIALYYLIKWHGVNIVHEIEQEDVESDSMVRLFIIYLIRVKIYVVKNK